jgi:phenylacetate-CoA ligase
MFTPSPTPAKPSEDDDDGEQWLDRVGILALQRRKLAAMFGAVRATNPFYRQKLADARIPAGCETIEALPFTTRAELEADQAAHPPFGTNLTYPLSCYSRYHQTSGTGGRPVRWLDTVESWGWFKRCWRYIYRAAGVGVAPGGGREDRLLFPFSFGPFIGFWAAFESAASMGLLTIPAGGLSTTARLRMLLDNEVTVVCCTPTYALRMAEVAAEQNIDLARSAVRALFVAGEPGGNIPETRSRIESAWGARLFDHSGMTEMGAVSFECAENPGGLHVTESEFIAEVVDPETLKPLPDGSTGELVLTNLGRWGSPLIRYRTGDQVRLTRADDSKGRCACGRWFARLEGGILGRIDDMFIVRGNNVFPTAVEAVIRRFPEVAEFRLTVLEGGPLTQVRLEIEPAAGVAPDGLVARVAHSVQESLSFRADVAHVPPGTLPRFEMKAKRFVKKKLADA